MGDSPEGHLGLKVWSRQICGTVDRQCRVSVSLDRNVGWTPSSVQARPTDEGVHPTVNTHPHRQLHIGLVIGFGGKSDIFVDRAQCEVRFNFRERDHGVKSLVGLRLESFAGPPKADGCRFVLFDEDLGRHRRNDAKSLTQTGMWTEAESWWITVMVAAFASRRGD